MFLFFAKDLIQYFVQCIYKCDGYVVGTVVIPVVDTVLISVVDTVVLSVVDTVVLSVVDTVVLSVVDTVVLSVVDTVMLTAILEKVIYKYIINGIFVDKSICCDFTKSKHFNVCENYIMFRTNKQESLPPEYYVIYGCSWQIENDMYCTIKSGNT